MVQRNEKRAMSVASLSPPTPYTALVSLLSVALSSVTDKSRFMIQPRRCRVNIQLARKHCSIQAERPLNLSGIDAQLSRFCRSISAAYAHGAAADAFCRADALQITVGAVPGGTRQISIFCSNLYSISLCHGAIIINMLQITTVNKCLGFDFCDLRRYMQYLNR